MEVWLCKVSIVMDVGITVIIVIVCVIAGIMFLSCLCKPKARSMTGRGPNTA